MARDYDKPLLLSGETSVTTLCRLNAGGIDAPVFQYFPTLRIEFLADMDCDADGANGQSVVNGVPQFAYRPDGRGLDNNKNAGWPNGEYWNVLVCNNNKQPIKVSNSGVTGWLSATTYHRPGKSLDDANCYLDSYSIEYIVIEGFIRRRSKGVVLGCRGRATNINNGRTIPTITGDIGPLYKIGEGSMATCRGLELNDNPRNGGTSDRIIHYELFPNQPAIIHGELFQLIKAAG